MKSCPISVWWDLWTQQVLRFKAGVKQLCSVPRLGRQKEGTGVSWPNFQKQKNVGIRALEETAKFESQSPGSYLCALGQVSEPHSERHFSEPQSLHLLSGYNNSTLQGCHKDCRGIIYAEYVSYA